MPKLDNQMKILVFSDLHLNTWRSFGLSDKPGITKRLNDQINVLEQIKEIISEQKIKIVIFGGDLFHSVGFVPVECLNIACDFFNWLKEKKIIYYVTHGNHDLINRETPIWYQSSVTPFIQSHDEILNLKIRCVDWNEKIDYDELIDFDIIVLHKQPSITNEYNIKFEDVDWNRLAVQNRLVFFGHWHTKEILLPNCIILGSVMPLSFGDIGERGVWIVDSINWNSEFIELKSPKFLTVEISNEVKLDGNYYRVLHSDRKIDDENVISIIEPKHFEERIKSSNFDEILNEWLLLNNKNVQLYKDVISEQFEDKMQLSVDVFSGKLSHVKIQNFMSIGDIEFVISNGLTFIKGRNDIFDTNGSGKTAVCEAIYWCLFGETTKELTGDDVIRRECKDCSVELILIDKNSKVYINRSRKRGLIVRQIDDNNEKNLTEGRRQIECQSILESLLGFDKNVFLASCYFSQESLSLFTQLGDADRTNMIAHLLGFEIYDNLYDKVKKYIDKELLNLDNISLEIDKFNRKIELLENDKDSVLNRLVEINDSILSIEKKNLLNERDLINYNKQLEEIEKSEKFEIDSSQTDDAINENLLAVEVLNAKIEILEKEKNLKVEQFNELKLNRSQILVKIDVLSDKLNELIQQSKNLRNSEIGSKCDKCGSIISSDNIEKFVDEKTKLVIESQSKIDDCNLKLENLENLFVGISSEIKDYNIKLENYKNEIKILNKKLQDLNSQKFIELEKIHLFQEKISKLNSLEQIKKQNIAELKIELLNLNKQFSQYDKQRNLIESEIINLKNNIDKQKILGIEINQKIEILIFWKESFSSKGICSLLLDRFCNEFNTIVNEYLSIVSNGLMNVIINPIKILKSGEERNKIDFDISLNNNVVKYNSLSGGEKRRLDISMCLALNKWVSNKFMIKSGLLGILILDEIFSYIDRLGEETIATLLFNESRNRAMFVISHTPELISYADRDMTIIKENGISKLE